MPRTLHIDVHFDLICPWCLIGKGLLKQALGAWVEEEPDVQVRVQWHSLQLIPDVPAEGWPFATFYEQRLGSPEAVQRRQGEVLAAAQRAHVSVDFASIQRFPNTARAHRLLMQARGVLDDTAFENLLDRLFAAYFSRGEDLGDPDFLLEIAAEHGVDALLVQSAWQCTDPVGDARFAYSGVPLFVFNNSRALAGAQPVEALLTAMRSASVAVCTA